MLSSYAIGIGKEIVTKFMDLLGANSPSAADFFSADATIDWKDESDSTQVKGRLEIFDFFKRIPLFQHQLIEFDSQPVVPIPQLTMVTSDGILLISGDPTRYHATFLIKYSEKTLKAHIVHLALAYV